VKNQRNHHRSGDNQEDRLCFGGHRGRLLL
jgi:hypothetical protein